MTDGGGVGFQRIRDGDITASCMTFSQSASEERNSEGGRVGIREKGREEGPRERVKKGGGYSHAGRLLQVSPLAFASF